MCFWKSKQSKVLRAKRDIIVYKIGDFADKDTFVPYYMDTFTYKINKKYQTCPDFKGNSITVGFHSYINIMVNAVKSYYLHVVIQQSTKQKLVISTYLTLQDTLYLGKFIIPKGAIYCVNDSNEIVSNKIIYTGQYADVREILDVNLKDFFNSI